uniref:Uncharacterized protein n=1 Tax=Arundo donax TaxID=35708 RepID=A0A0A8Y2G9_ARUDO
MLYTVPSCEIL